MPPAPTPAHRIGLTLVSITPLVAFAVAHAATPAPSPERLGGAYIDPRHLTKLRFGTHSHWLQPWRAYQETLPARQFLNAQGVVLELPDRENPDLIVEMLARHGIRNARIEISWGFVNYFDEAQVNHAERLKRLLQACRRHGLRPLILLNGHEGSPAPMNVHERILAAAAGKGDRQVTLTDVSELKAGYSGLANLTGFRGSEALITRIEGNTVQLSKPLPKDLGGPGAKVTVTTLKYRPFSAPGSADYRSTVEGWKRYVATVARFVTEQLGTRGQADVGFDLEIWNELTFGSAFLSINNYYEPKLLQYDEESIWKNLVRETADYVTEHALDFRGVTLVDGFRNTIPWPAASQEPARVGALSFHPYPSAKRYPADEQQGPSINARFGEETPPAFTPTYTAIFPEYLATALQTETAIRDMAPLTTPISEVQHGRNSRRSNGKPAPCPLWLTEMGLHPQEHAGIKDRDAALKLKARTTARIACFFVGKGVERLYFFSALNGDTGFGLVQDNFAEYARSHSQYPAADAPYVSPALRTLGRLTAKIRQGLDPKLTQTRPLTIASITDTHYHVQFHGDGSPEHPDLYNREVLFLTPLQANAHRFVLPYYVMTRDITRALAPEEYTVRLQGVRGQHATVTAYDPLTDASVPVRVVARSGTELTVTLTATDYPRLLALEA